MSTKKIFLLLTHSHDFYCIDLVAAHLKEQGFESLRMNTDHLPKYRLVWNFGNEKKGFALTIGKRTVTSEDVAAVWIRKALFPPQDPTIDPAYRSTVAGEVNEITRSFMLQLSEYPSLDPFDLVDRAESKPLQQEYAIQCGITVPPSIICNSLKEGRGFMQAKDKKYITKLLRPIGWSMGAGSNFFYTSFIEKKDLNADHFSVHPVLIQEFVPKQYELRVIYVGGSFFSGKLSVEEYESDWRRPGRAAEWSAYNLPATECKKLHRMMKMLGLNFGAIDIIRGTDNKYYFLEVNPVGEWGMLEKFIGLPISAAIAKHLIKISKQ